jgi:hypothetical protein
MWTICIEDMTDYQEHLEALGTPFFIAFGEITHGDDSEFWTFVNELEGTSVACQISDPRFSDKIPAKLRFDVFHEDFSGRPAPRGGLCFVVLTDSPLAKDALTPGKTQIQLCRPGTDSTGCQAAPESEPSRRTPEELAIESFKLAGVWRES